MKKISLKRWLIYLLKDLKAIIYKRYTYNYISQVGFQSRPFFYYIKKEEIILANNEKILNSRLQQKHDIEANWIKATNFRPKPGEIIIYDADENYPYPRVKIGNEAEDLVNDLPFLPSGGNGGIYIGSGEMPEGYNIQIDPNGDALDSAEIFEHIENKNNPHEVTAEQIGAAPKDVIIDKSLTMELWNGMDDGIPYREWTKRADGTFTFWGEVESTLMVDETIVYTTYHELPFDIVSLETVSCSIISDGDDDPIRDEIMNTLVCDVYSYGDIEGPCGMDHVFDVGVYATDETFEKMNEAGEFELSVYITIWLTGRWRE